MSQEILTVEQAKALLPVEKEKIHVFMNSSNTLIGCDWPRGDIDMLLEKAERIEVGGEQCVRLKHGLVATRNGREHFIESKAGIA